MSPVMLEEAAVQQAASRWQARHPMRLLLIYEFLTPPPLQNLNHQSVLQTSPLVTTCLCLKQLFRFFCQFSLSLRNSLIGAFWVQNKQHP